MPSYEMTGQHSHRHPFLGESEGARVQDGDQSLFDYYGVEHGSGVFDDRNSIFAEEPFGGEYVPLLDADPEVQSAKVFLDDSLGDADLAKTVTDAAVKAKDPVNLLMPVIQGLGRAALMYAIMRSFDVAKADSRKVAIAVGLIEGVGVIAGNWLRGKMGDLSKPAPKPMSKRPSGK